MLICLQCPFVAALWRQWCHRRLILNKCSKYPCLLLHTHPTNVTWPPSTNGSRWLAHSHHPSPTEWHQTPTTQYRQMTATNKWWTRTNDNEQLTMNKWQWTNDNRGPMDNKDSQWQQGNTSAYHHKWRWGPHPPTPSPSPTVDLSPLTAHPSLPLASLLLFPHALPPCSSFPPPSLCWTWIM